MSVVILNKKKYIYTHLKNYERKGFTIDLIKFTVNTMDSS
jgi:hypothetical protein